MALGNDDGSGHSRKGVRHWMRTVLRPFGIACAIFLIYSLGFATLDLVRLTPVDDWSIDRYWRAIDNEHNITLAAIMAILMAGGWNVIVAVVRKIAWHLDFPARFRDRIRELDRDE